MMARGEYGILSREKHTNFKILKFRWKKPSPRQGTNFPESTSGGRKTFGATAELTSLLGNTAFQTLFGSAIKNDEQVTKNQERS